MLLIVGLAAKRRRRLGWSVEDLDALFHGIWLLADHFICLHNYVLPHQCSQLVVILHLPNRLPVQLYRGQDLVLFQDLAIAVEA